MHTVTFGPGGTTKEIGLSTGEAVALRADLASWVIHARETHRPKATRRTGRPHPGTVVGGNDSTIFREWARANGHPVSDRGRLRAAVRQAHHAANRIEHRGGRRWSRWPARAPDHPEAGQWCRRI